MEKLKMETNNLVDKNINKIAEIFPDVVTETKGENGIIKRAVNFDNLKQDLSDYVVEGDKERYELTWPGKKEAILIANQPINKTLRPVKEDSVNWDTTENLYIEGDNLEVLKLLQESYLNKIKCIYIDPPYNTGNDFIYKDDFKEDKDEYLGESGQVDGDGNRLLQNTESNGRFHSDWLTMIYPRLKLARNLLSEDGVVFISIDDNEVDNLRKVCDELFSPNNFISCLPWKGKGGGADSKYLMQAHEYILFYCKNKEKLIIGEEIKGYENFPKYDSIKKRYYKIQLARKWGANSRRQDRPNLYYGIAAPDGEIIYPILPDRSDGRWRWSKSKMEKELKEGNLEFIKDNEEWNVYEKIYKPKEGEFNTKKYSTWLDDVGNTANGTKEVKQLFDIKVFDFPKPIDLLKRLIEISNNTNGIVLDFFSGSATTAHAVMQLNTEDGGQRKYIMVQLPELCDEKSESYKAGYKNICEIGKERIRRAAKKIKDETNADIDYGFRVFRVSTSNMKNVYYAPNKIEQNLLTKFESNIKEDRNSDDLLIQVMLELGLELSLPVITKIIDGKVIYFVSGNSLCACFDDNITDEVIKEIAKVKPLRAIFKDCSFKNDADKINVEEIFKVLSPSTEIKVI